MPVESAKLREGRRLLAQFEQSIETDNIDGDSKLHDALDVLAEVLSSSIEQERRIALNLLKTYAHKIERHADRVLEDIRSATNGQIARCHHIMLELEHSCVQISDSYHQKRLKLSEELAESIYDQLPRSGIRRHPQGPFVASEIGQCFHRPGCEWVRYISSGNLLEFETHEQAVADGYKPCKTCRA